MKTLRRILLFACLLLVAWIVWQFRGCFQGKQSKESTFKMNEFELFKASKLITTEIHGTATGRYGYKYILVTNLPFIGHREDTMCWDCPGSRYVDIGGRANFDVGYDCLKGDKLFTDDAVGEDEETSSMYHLKITTGFPPPRLITANVRCFPKQSGSFFTGNVTEEEFFSYVDTASAQVCQQIIAGDQNFFYSAYVQGIGPLIYQVLQTAHPGKEIKLEIFVEGQLVPMNDNFEPLKKNVMVDVGRTMYRGGLSPY